MPRPYDQLFKGLAEDDPRGLLHLFGSLPLGAQAEIEVVDRELGLPVLSVDRVYRIRAGARERLVHYEAQTRYQADVPTRLAWYAVALALKFKIPIETVLILLVERHAPRRVPAAWRIPLGSLGISLRYRVVRLWEMDPAPILAAGRPFRPGCITATAGTCGKLPATVPSLTMPDMAEFPSDPQGPGQDGHRDVLHLGPSA